MENIRMATEKQINLINALIDNKRGGMELLVEFKECDREKLKRLTIEAASDIISRALDFVRNIDRYTEVDCEEMDTILKAYNRMLEFDCQYIPKCRFEATTYHEGKHVLGLWQNGYYDYEVTFKFGDVCTDDVLIFVDHKLDAIRVTTYEPYGAHSVTHKCVDGVEVPSIDEFEAPEPFDGDGNEDWYREGSGQYYEDRAEAACGYEY